MILFIIALLLVILSIGIHLFLLRLSPLPHFRNAMLFSVIVDGVVVYSVIAWFGSKSTLATSGSVWTMPAILSCELIYILFMLAYAVFFATAKEESPSQVMLMALKRQDGCTYSQLLEEFNKVDFIKPRLDTLVLRNIVVQESNRYRLSMAGRFSATAIGIYKNLLRRNEGG